jgi:phage/plasmid-associated DNA primase
LVVAEELQENRKYPMDELKLYIGNTANTAEKKGQATPVHFVNKATLVQLTNVVPKIYHLDASKERRIQVLPFRNSSYRIGENGVKDNPHGVFPVDNNIGSVMQDEEEMAGFLNHILAGWLRLARNSFQMRPPKVAEAARQEFMKQASPVRRFLGECTDYAEPGIKHAKYRVPKQDLYHAFERWCREEGIRTMPMQTSFTQEAAQIMSRYGIEEGKAGGVRLWLGLQLTTEFDAEDDWGDL